MPEMGNRSKRAILLSTPTETLFEDVVAVGKLSGAVGTSAHLSPKVEAFVCRKLGLRPAPIATQVIQRDLHAEFINALAQFEVLPLHESIEEIAEGLAREQ